MILVRSSKKRKSIIKASPQDIKVNDMYWINLSNTVDIALSIQLFAASTGTFESKQISAKDHGAYTKCIYWHLASKEHECHWPPPETEATLCICVS